MRESESRVGGGMEIFVLCKTLAKVVVSKLVVRFGSAA